MQKTDWDHIHNTKYSDNDPPEYWPKYVKAVSINGLSLLGVDKNNNLYWDGKLIRSRITFNFWQSVGTSIIVISTAIMAIIDILQFLKI